MPAVRARSRFGPRECGLALARWEHAKRRPRHDRRPERAEHANPLAIANDCLLAVAADIFDVRDEAAQVFADGPNGNVFELRQICINRDRFVARKPIGEHVVRAPHVVLRAMADAAYRVYVVGRTQSLDQAGLFAPRGRRPAERGGEPPLLGGSDCVQWEYCFTTIFLTSLGQCRSRIFRTAVPTSGKCRRSRRLSATATRARFTSH